MGSFENEEFPSRPEVVCLLTRPSVHGPSPNPVFRSLAKPHVNLATATSQSPKQHTKWQTANPAPAHQSTKNAEADRPADATTEIDRDEAEVEAEEVFDGKRNAEVTMNTMEERRD